MALDVLVNEDLSARANKMGALLVSTIKAASPPHLLDIQGAGLFLSLVIDMKAPKVTPKRLVSLCIQRGVLVSIAGPDRVRMCPPLVITEDEALKGANIIIKAFEDLQAMGDLPAEVLPENVDRLI